MKKFEYRLEELHIDIKSALNPVYTELHDQLEEKLNELKDQNDVIEEIRGEGLLIGIKLNNEKMTAREFAEKALENKFLVVPAGDNVVRYFPPLNVTKEEIDISIEKIKKVKKSLVY